MRILIIRPGAIGDTLLSFPVIRALREYSTNPHVIFVGNAAVLPLAFASGLVEETSDYEDTRWSALFSTTGLGAINWAPTGLDLAICWLRDPDDIVERNLHAAGVRRAIVAPGRPPEGQRIHIVDYLAKTVGVRIDAEPAGPIFTVDSVYSPSLYDIAIHPGSGGTHKCWPTASFASVIHRLHERGQRVLLLGGPADHQRAAEIMAMVDCAPTMLLDAPLIEVARRLGQCRCYLGNDSGITHLAAMLGVPTIALFGPSDPVVWHPVGPAVEVIHAPRWEEITVDRVVKSVMPYVT